MSILLALAITAQYGEPVQAIHENVRMDLAFLLASEDFVVGMPGCEPPEPCRSLFRRMGSTAWREREKASREADAYFADHPEDARWLFVGRRSKDHEIGLRAHQVIRRLYPCRACNGTGVSHNWSEWPCDDCDGTRTAFPASPWD